MTGDPEVARSSAHSSVSLAKSSQLDNRSSILADGVNEDQVRCLQEGGALAWGGILNRGDTRANPKSSST
jgi:hypothetical protein